MLLLLFSAKCLSIYFVNFIPFWQQCSRDHSASLQEMISSISGRIPPTVEDSIKKHLSSYASNITSVLSQFPSQQVKCYTRFFLGTTSSLTSRFRIRPHVETQLFLRTGFRPNISGENGYRKWVEMFENAVFVFSRGHLKKEFCENDDVARTNLTAIGFNGAAVGYEMKISQWGATRPRASLATFIS